jgi:hypothetical protein
MLVALLYLVYTDSLLSEIVGFLSCSDLNNSFSLVVMFC